MICYHCKANVSTSDLKHVTGANYHQECYKNVVKASVAPPVAKPAPHSKASEEPERRLPPSDWNDVIDRNTIDES